MHTIICQYCGKKLSPEATICGRCGAVHFSEYQASLPFVAPVEKVKVRLSFYFNAIEGNARWGSLISPSSHIAIDGHELKYFSWHTERNGVGDYDEDEYITISVGEHILSWRYGRRSDDEKFIITEGTGTLRVEYACCGYLFENYRLLSVNAIHF